MTDNKNIYSLDSFLSFTKNNFVLIVLMAFFFLAGFASGSLWTENQILKSGGSYGSGAKAGTDTAAAPTQPAAGKRDLSIAALTAKAEELGADKADFEACVNSGEMAQKVKDDMGKGQSGGVNGTPGTVVIVNGKPAELINGALPYDQVKAIVDKYVKGGAIDPTKQAAVANHPALTDKDHVKGNRNAKVVLVEYSDYECPFCERFHPTIVKISEEYKNDVAWAFRHFPLSFHPYAQKSAEAAECVAKLEGNDAFWEYTDMLFASVN